MVRIGTAKAQSDFAKFKDVKSNMIDTQRELDFSGSNKIYFSQSQNLKQKNKNDKVNGDFSQKVLAKR